MQRRTLLSTAVTVTLVGCGGGEPTPERSGTGPIGPTGTPPPSPAPPAPPQTIAENLNVPWSLAFLPGWDALVGERETRRILRVPAQGGTPTEVIRIADVATDTTEEGGLLGVRSRPPSRTTTWSTPTTRRPRTTGSCGFPLGATAVQPILTGLV